jgi:hypothetical protein
MTPKAIATLLTVFVALTTAGENSALAQDRNLKGGGFVGSGGGFRGGAFHGRGFQKRSSPVVVGGYIGDFGSVGNDGYADNNGYGNGYGDWYGISSGHDECPLFRQHVKTPNGWGLRIVPNC